MGHQSEIKNRILGYSERGIINSLIFSIGEDNELMGKFIGLIGIDEIKELGKPTDYEILLEQSFSDFGDADLIIIIKYENPLREIVLFIEGKVKTYLVKQWYLENQFKNYAKEKKYTGATSNLFFQLYLKTVLMKEKVRIFENKKNNVQIETKFRARKIGENSIVWKALEKLLKCDKAYYVGLIPSTEDEIKNFITSKEFVEKMDFEMSFLAWETVENFCRTYENPNGKEELIHPKLKKVVDIFEYNKGQIY